MIPRRVMVNLFVFFGVSFLLVAYGAFTLLQNPLRPELHASTILPDASGLRAGFSVTLRGVPVGSVQSLKLAPHGVRADLAIHPGSHVPADVSARTQRANPLGEQQLDLVPGPNAAAGGELRNHAVIPIAADPTPPDVGQVVDAADRILAAIPPDQLTVAVHEGALALRGRADDLRTIIEGLDRFSATFVQYDPEFRQLLAASPPVLDAVSSQGPQLRQALADTRVLLDVLTQRRDDLVRLYEQGASLGELGTNLLNAELPNLACLTHDITDVTLNIAQPARLAQVDSGLLLNSAFFGPIDRLSPAGPAVSLGPGSVTRDDQTWLRVRTLLPPQQPPAQAYPAHLPIPPTKPGAACVTSFGHGVGPATQANAAPPAPGGKVVTAPASEAQVSGSPAPTGAVQPAAYTAPVHPGALPLIGLALAGLALAAGLVWHPVPALARHPLTSARRRFTRLLGRRRP